VDCRFPRLPKTLSVLSLHTIQDLFSLSVVKLHGFRRDGFSDPKAIFLEFRAIPLGGRTYVPFTSSLQEKGSPFVRTVAHVLWDFFTSL